MKWYLQVIKNYANFKGRARRIEYWMFTLFNVIFFIAAMIIDNLLGTTFSILPYGLFYLLYALFAFIPNLAVTIRRLHDVNKSGWFFLLVLIPLVGPIWLLILFCTDGTHGENSYGNNPKDFDPNPELNLYTE